MATRRASAPRLANDGNAFRGANAFARPTLRHGARNARSRTDGAWLAVAGRTGIDRLTPRWLRPVQHVPGQLTTARVRLLSGFFKVARLRRKRQVTTLGFG